MSMRKAICQQRGIQRVVKCNAVHGRGASRIFKGGVQDSTHKSHVMSLAMWCEHENNNNMRIFTK